MKPEKKTVKKSVEAERLDGGGDQDDESAGRAADLVSAAAQRRD